MCEGRIHNLAVSNAKKQFVYADAGEQAFFTQQTRVGCAIELNQVAQLGVIVRELGKHCAFGAVFRWNETMRAAEGAFAHGGVMASALVCADFGLAIAGSRVFRVRSSSLRPYLGRCAQLPRRASRSRRNSIMPGWPRRRM